MNITINDFSLYFLWVELNFALICNPTEKNSTYIKWIGYGRNPIDISTPVFVNWIKINFKNPVNSQLKGTQDWNFFGFDFEIFFISLLVMSKY